MTLTDLPGNLPLLEENCSGNGAQSATVVQLVWGADVAHLNPPFDLVFATDVIYDGSVIHQLVESLVRLSDKRTRILVAYGRNRWAEEEFLKAIQPFFILTEVEKGDLDSIYTCDDVKVLNLTSSSQRIQHI